MIRTLTYSSWQNMKTRCLNPKVDAYKDYGGRGITVCQRWLEFRGFLEDMGERPGREFTLERSNNDLGYYKENCKWATKSEQSRNTRRTWSIEFNGEIYTVDKLSEMLHVSRDCIKGRIRDGWTIEKILGLEGTRIYSIDDLVRLTGQLYSPIKTLRKQGFTDQEILDKFKG